MSDWVLRQAVNGWEVHRALNGGMYLSDFWIADTPHDAAKIIVAEEKAEAAKREATQAKK